MAPFPPHCPNIFYAVLPGISRPRTISAAKGTAKIIAVALASGILRDCGFFSNHRMRKGQDNRPGRNLAGHLNPPLRKQDLAGGLPEFQRFV
ncbi:hypothetical protein FACS189485_14850 [Spirochaetia bacterium]|nr:hypothetical protein FACS189485_14850 [Spirochaetia bacterium]